MKSKSNKLGNLVAKAAYASASVSVNTACALFYHQPKVPASAKKLRKF